MAIEITDILGATRPVLHTWPDGSHECPFCGYAARGQCENPACSACKWATPANRHHFEEKAREQATRAAEEAQRKRNHEIAMRRIEEDRQARLAAVRELSEQVRIAGGCWECSYRRGKVLRHRGECPRKRH